MTSKSSTQRCPAGKPWHDNHLVRAVVPSPVAVLYPFLLASRRAHVCLVALARGCGAGVGAARAGLKNGHAGVTSPAAPGTTRCALAAGVRQARQHRLPVAAGTAAAVPSRRGPGAKGTPSFAPCRPVSTCMGRSSCCCSACYSQCDEGTVLAHAGGARW